MQFLVNLTLTVIREKLWDYSMEKEGYEYRNMRYFT